MATRFNDPHYLPLRLSTGMTEKEVSVKAKELRTSLLALGLEKKSIYRWSLDNPFMEEHARLTMIGMARRYNKR
jgi:hypothetical protein